MCLRRRCKAMKFKCRPSREASEREEEMGYLLRVRFAAFFAGAAAASLGGIYMLHKDYKVAHESIAKQICW
uniref:Uncharacterized protein n=1 Tax=Kalanchoe fedtschenkoi TaxID=63787 RepID=A0A7N0U9M4_KALFE